MGYRAAELARHRHRAREVVASLRLLVSACDALGAFAQGEDSVCMTLFREIDAVVERQARARTTPPSG